jgi:hypothetical protein
MPSVQARFGSWREPRVPFILRWDKENQYRIIGEAYVHGVMYGEETGETKEIRLV